MKKISLNAFLIGALLLSTIGFSQSCPIPEPLDKEMAIGSWTGNFTLDGEIKSLRLNLSAKNNELNALLTIPFISKKNIKTETEICQFEELHIKFKVDNKNYELVGRIKNTKMTGRLSLKNDSLFSSEDNIQEIFSLKKSNNKN